MKNFKEWDRSDRKEQLAVFIVGAAYTAVIFYALVSDCIRVFF